MARISYNQATKLFEHYLAAIKRRQGDYEQTNRVILEPYPPDMLYEIRENSGNAAIYDLALSVYHGQDPRLTLHESRTLREKLKAICAGRVEANPLVGLPEEQQPADPAVPAAQEPVQPDEPVSDTRIVIARR